MLTESEAVAMPQLAGLLQQVRLLSLPARGEPHPHVAHTAALCAHRLFMLSWGLCVRACVRVGARVRGWWLLHGCHTARAGRTGVVDE